MAGGVAGGGLQGCMLRGGRTRLAPAISPSLASGKEQGGKTLGWWSCPQAATNTTREIASP